MKPDIVFIVITGCPLIRVRGNHGVGITSILAKTYQNLSRRSPRMCLIPCFKEVCSSALTMLTFLYEELLKSVHMDVPDSNETHKVSVEQIASNIVTLLSSLKDSSSRNFFKIVIVMDGLSSFYENDAKTKSNLLGWLPLKIPDFLTVVVSTDNSTKWKTTFESRSDPVTNINISELQISRRKEVLRDFLSKHGRVLDEKAFHNQLQQIALKRDSGKAGYLKMVAQELMAHGHIDNMAEHVSRIAQTTQQAVVQILERLKENYGQRLFFTVAGILLVGSQFGEVSRELLFQISERALPEVSDLRTNIILLLQELESYILRTDDAKNEMTVTNPDILSRFIKDNDVHLEPIRQFFVSTLTSKYYSQGPASLLDPNLLLALPFHLSTSSTVKELQNLLDIRYICMAAETDILKSVKPYFLGISFPVKRDRDKFLSSKKIQAYSDFLAKGQTFFSNGTAMEVLQHALGESESSVVYQDALHYLRTMIKHEVWCLKVRQFSRSTGEVLNSYALDKQSTLTVSAVEKIPTKLDDVYHAHGFTDGTIVVCKGIDAEGENHLIGHSSSISALCFVPGTCIQIIPQLN